MAVVTPSLKDTETGSLKNENKKFKKSLDKCRPITATLEHPLILDIKLLQKLDMTTFTRKGLIALAKFCGISLITTNASKRKLSKCMKAIKGPKKLLDKDSCRGVTKQQGVESNKSESRKFKRKLIKPKILRFKPRINLKIVDLQKNFERAAEEGGGEKGQEEVEEEEDSSDVICRKHEKSTENGNQALKQKHKPLKESASGGKKAVAVNDLSPVIEVIPEPCKSCNRTRQPERLHSHPRILVKVIESDRMKAAEKKTLDERFKPSCTNKNAADTGNAKKSFGKCNLKGRNLCAKGSPQKCHLTVSEYQKDSASSRASLKSRDNSGSSSKSVSSFEFSESSERKNSANVRVNKKSSLASPARTSSRNEILKMDDVKKSENGTNKKSPPRTPDSDALKYVTGCYICGSQVSPKARMQHEKECILEWRNQNSLLPAEDRKAEPIRPDYRFTASGELDCEGTFESIWANHKDSLIPCKTCGRKFFPDRIERHQNCCYNLSLRIKYKH